MEQLVNELRALEQLAPEPRAWAQMDVEQVMGELRALQPLAEEPRASERLAGQQLVWAQAAGNQPAWAQPSEPAHERRLSKQPEVSMAEPAGQRRGALAVPPAKAPLSPLLSAPTQPWREHGWRARSLTWRWVWKRQWQKLA